MKITISRGATINLGSYESSRIDIGCEVEGDTKDFQAADKWVIDQLNKAVKDIQVSAGLAPNPVARFTGKA